MTKSEMIYTDFMKDIETYLRSRYQGVPDHEILETSAYIATRCAVMTNDLVRIACDQLSKDFHRSMRRSPRSKTKDEEVSEDD